MIKVLFTGGGGAGNEALWRLLNNRYELHFADADRNNINPIIPEDRRHLIPFADESEFIIKMIGLCLRLGIDLIIPGVDEELLLFAKNIHSFLPTKLLLPDTKYIETMLDKLNMIRTLEEKRIKVPFTCLLTDWFNINYPCIIKPRHGRGSRGLQIVNNFSEIEDAYLREWPEEMILQQKIEGIEYTVQMIVDSQAQLKSIVPIKIDIKKGITIRAETDDNKYVLEACKKIHEVMPTKGCYNIQLMLTKDNEVYPFEINPRISTTFCMTVAAGIDPIDIFLNGNNSEELLPFNKIKLQRHWTNYFTECL